MNHPQQDTPFGPAPVFQVTISLAAGEYDYDVEHRLPERPSAELLADLRDEASKVFEALYGREAEDCGVSVWYISENKSSD